MDSDKTLVLNKLQIPFDEFNSIKFKIIPFLFEIEWRFAHKENRNVLFYVLSVE